MEGFRISIVRILTEVLRVILFYTRPYSDVLFSYIEPIFMGRTKPLPPIQSKILLMSATELASKIRKRQLKCEDVMRAYVDRARAVQPIINAIADARYDDALEESKLVDRFLASTDKRPEEIEKGTPLLGVPFSCKEPIGIKGLSQTDGIVKCKGRKAEKDGDTTALYRAAGAIPVTVTNTPELSMWWNSSNLVNGITKNPYDHSRTVGGSTGGEGALIASAGALIGIGNDIGGSIRIPACFNGIYGHKPSSGLVSNIGHYPVTEKELDLIGKFLCTGPMCRYAEDLPLLLRLLSGNDQRIHFDTKVDFSKIKVYYIEEFPGNCLSAVPTVKQAIKNAANYFKEQFDTQIIPLKINELDDSHGIWECKYLETDIFPFENLIADENGKVNLWCEFLKSVLRLSNHTFPTIFYSMTELREKDQHYHDGLKKYDALQQKFQEIFQEDAIVLVPTHPEPAPFYHLTVPKFQNIGYTSIFNILGFPATNVPAGFCDGVPIGIQTISNTFKDHLTIAAAIELDKLFGGWKSPCPVVTEAL